MRSRLSRRCLLRQIPDRHVPCGRPAAHRDRVTHTTCPPPHDRTAVLTKLERQPWGSRPASGRRTRQSRDTPLTCDPGISRNRPRGSSWNISPGDHAASPSTWRCRQRLHSSPRAEVASCIIVQATPGQALVGRRTPAPARKTGTAPQCGRSRPIRPQPRLPLPGGGTGPWFQEPGPCIRRGAMRWVSVQGICVSLMLPSGLPRLTRRLSGPRERTSSTACTQGHILET